MCNAGVIIIVIISSVHCLPINPSEPGVTSGDFSGECVQSVVCAIDNLRDALKTLPNVELQPCPSVSVAIIIRCGTYFYVILYLVGSLLVCSKQQ